MFGIRKFEHVSGTHNGAATQGSGIWVPVPKVADNANRANTVLVGRIGCQCTAGDSTAGDAWSAANTTGTPGRLGFGLITCVTDKYQRRLDRQFLLTTDEGGFFFIPARGNLFRGIEDAQGGALADSAMGLFVSMAIGTVTGLDQTLETNYHNPMGNDMLDSSTTDSGTAANRAFALVRPDPDITNQALPAAVGGIGLGARIWLFTLTDAFTLATVQ